MQMHRLALLLVSGAAACTGGSSDGGGGGSPADARDAVHDARIGDATDVPDGAPAPDGTPAPDAGPGTDAMPSADASSACGMAPTGNWRGTSRIQNNGSSGFTYVEGDVEWVLATTEGCVDTFRPTGIVRYGVENSGGSGHDQVAAQPGDGTLVIDRTAAIATYIITASTAPVGAWADHRGSFDGRMVGGFLYGQVSRTWSIARVDAEFPSPSNGCSEPPTETWQSQLSLAEFGGTADATWTRVSTTGCVDRFTPSGTARTGTVQGTDFLLDYDPSFGPIAANDAELVIDRSTSPPGFELRHGATTWPATLRRTYQNGTITTEQGEAITIWAEFFQGPYDGNHFSAQRADQTGWTFSREP
jgi:hypothetical protein